VPEAINLGARQQAVTHKLVGGRRIVDVLGLEYDNLNWSGWLLGDNASTRADQLQALCDAGAPQTFSLDHYAFTVLVAGFAIRFEHPYRRAYSIELLVIGRSPATSAGGGSAGGLDALVQNDLASALGLSALLNDPDVSAAIASVKQTVETVKQTVDNVKQDASRLVGKAQQIVHKVEQAQAVLTSVAARTDSIERIATLGGLVPGNPVAVSAERLLSQVAQAGRAPVVHQLQSVLGRLQKNLAVAPVAAGVQTVTTGNTSLQKLAVDAYGDASGWMTIALANGRDDPLVTGINQIVIPRENA